ncbi:MAG: hypothetical protein MUE42_08225 [Opitutaceae bacterium]|jgi:hypothetical protein|nr:hypothetical protein [Opitutaceae bacterium]
MPRPPKDDDFHAPESASFRKLVEHIIDEMRGHVIVAFFLVAFMFFYGMANSLFKLTGRELASLDYPLGVISGAVGSTLCTAWILKVKYRRK